MIVPSLPAVYTIELTPACSNGCPGCFNAFASERHHQALPAARWEAFIAEIAPHAARIRLTGGEPTLHPEFERIFLTACATGALVTVFTNGRWRLPERVIAALKGQPNLAGLLISMHGVTPATHEAFTRVRGSHAETLSNARRARDAGIPIAFSAVLTHQLLPELEELVAMAEVMGAEMMAINRYLGPGTPQNHLTRAEMLQVVRRIESMIAKGSRISYGACIPQCLRGNSSDGCMAGVTQITIDPWGETRPCIYAQSSTGSIFEKSLGAIWHGEAIQAWRAMEPEPCSTCAAYPVCHGGCRAARERYGTEDPLQGRARRRCTITRTLLPLPESARPSHALRIRPEPYGYSLIGGGQIWPIKPEGLEILARCDGKRTINELRALFGEEHIDLLQELWNAGLVNLAEA